MSTAEYGKANDDRGLLRRTLEGARDGMRSLFGRDEESKKADEDKKVFDTWVKELELADKFFDDYHDDALRAVSAFLDDQRPGGPTRQKYKLNLFNSNVTTMTSIMYAKLPKVEADRRFADPRRRVGEEGHLALALVAADHARPRTGAHRHHVGQRDLPYLPGGDGE